MTKITNNLTEICHNYNLILDSREIFLSGIDSEDSEVNYKMSMSFLKNLRILENINKKPIIIHQQTIGGDWSSGMMIYDLIKNSQCNFLFICHGISASMGSIIPQAVLNKGYRVSMPHTDFLIHEGDLYLEGIPTQVSSNLLYMNINKEIMYNIYCDSCVNGLFFKGYSRSKVKAYLKRKIREKTDWCLQPLDALNYGFVDGILGTKGYEDIKTILESL